jgi:hypothetical protein
MGEVKREAVREGGEGGRERQTENRGVWREGACLSVAAQYVTQWGYIIG